MMNRLLRCAALLFLLSASVLPASAGIFRKAYKYHDCGGIMLKDFAGPVLTGDFGDGPYMAPLADPQICIALRNRSIFCGNMLVTLPTPTAAMNRNSSWYRSGCNEDLLLKYAQAEFDMVELLCREYRDSIYSDPGCARRLSQIYGGYLNDRTAEFNSACAYGNDTSAVLFNSALYSSVLKESAVARKPAKPEAGFPWGGDVLTIGYAFETYASAHLSHMSGFCVGYDWVFNRFLLGVNWTTGAVAPIAGGELYYDDVRNCYWDESRPYLSSTATIRGGWMIKDGDWLSMVPYFAAGRTTLQQNIYAYEGGSRLSILPATRLELGMDLNLKLFRHAVYRQFSDTWEYCEHGITFRPALQYSRSAGSFPVFSFGLGAVYRFGWRN